MVIIMLRWSSTPDNIYFQIKAFVLFPIFVIFRKTKDFSPYSVLYKHPLSFSSYLCLRIKLFISISITILRYKVQV